MTPTEEKHLLVRVVAKLAMAQLNAGGFMPFGATLGNARDVQMLIPEAMKQGVTMDELDEYWTQELRKAAAAGQCKSVCSCTYGKIPTEDGTLVSALLIHVEHPEADAEDIVYPYHTDKDAKAVLDEPVSEVTERRVFSSGAHGTD
jgi:hypothetical protein